MSATSVVTGTPEQVILFGVKYLQSMNPSGWSDDPDLSRCIGSWAKGSGVFSNCDRLGTSVHFDAALQLVDVEVDGVTRSIADRLILNCQRAVYVAEWLASCVEEGQKVVLQ